MSSSEEVAAHLKARLHRESLASLCASGRGFSMNHVQNGGVGSSDSLDLISTWGQDT